MTMSESSGSDLGIDGLSRAQLIGSGGFARVYRAEHLGLQSLVAVKVLQFEPDERTRERFRRECVALGQLRGHPNIVTVFDEGFTREGRPYLLMEFAPGGTLSDELVRHGAMGWPEAVEISIKLAGAVETAHRHGLLHRDIKTANVLMSAYGEPQLADFGLSRFHDTEQSRTSNITATLAYAAPELLRGEQATVATDVYALAATLATLIVGKAPFIDDEASGPLPLLRRIDNDPPPDVRTLGAPADVAAAIETGMAKSPGDRPPTALAFAELLRNVQRAHGLDLTNIRLPAPLTTSPSIPVDVLTGDEYPTTIVDRTPAPPASEPPPQPLPEPPASHTPAPTAPPADADPEPTPRRSKLVPILVAVAAIIVAGLVIQPWKGSTNACTSSSQQNCGDSEATSRPTTIPAVPANSGANGRVTAVTTANGELTGYQYVVVKGDTLLSIARRMESEFGLAGLTAWDVINANRGELIPNSPADVGQVISIPIANLGSEDWDFIVFAEGSLTAALDRIVAAYKFEHTDVRFRIVYFATEAELGIAVSDGVPHDISVTHGKLVRFFVSGSAVNLSEVESFRQFGYSDQADQIFEEHDLSTECQGLVGCLVVDSTSTPATTTSTSSP